MGQGGGGTEGAGDTGAWVLADGIGAERGDAGATDAGSTRLRCDSDVRARGAGGVAVDDGPSDGSDGATEATTGGAVLRVTGNVMGRMAKARRLCGLLPVDMAVDGANGAEGEAAFVHRLGSEGMWTEMGVTGDMGVATGIGAKPNEGCTTCPEGQEGRGTCESDPDR